MTEWLTSSYGQAPYLAPKLVQVLQQKTVILPPVDPLYLKCWQCMDILVVSQQVAKEKNLIISCQWCLPHLKTLLKPRTSV